MASSAESQRCPSKWGAGDERGSANHMKPASVLRAAQLIKTGEAIEIAHVMNDKMPFFGPIKAQGSTGLSTNRRH